MDFLSVGVWAFELLVLTLLPAVSVIMALVFIYKICDASQETFVKWFKSMTSKLTGK